MSPFVARLLFIVSLFAASGFVLVTVDSMPLHVATQFGVSGKPTSWMSRDGYRLFMLCFAIGVPLFVVAIVALLPRRFPNYINIPNRYYWLAPIRRETSVAFLSISALWLGIVMSTFAGAVHWLTLHANMGQPPQLENKLLFAVMGVFLLAVSVWAAALIRRFRKPSR